MTIEELIDAGRVICPSCGNDADFVLKSDTENWDKAIKMLGYQVENCDVICGNCGWAKYVGAETNDEKCSRDKQTHQGPHETNDSHS